MERPQDAAVTRERPLDPKRTCLLLVDTQNHVWNAEVAERQPEFDRTLRETVLPNLQRLIARGGRDRLMVEVPQHLGRGHADQRVVVDQEDGAAAMRLERRDRRRGLAAHLVPLLMQ